MAEIITKDVLTLEELKNLTGQAAKAAVIYDTSTGEPNGLDVEIFINMDASIGVVDASVQALEQQASDLEQQASDLSQIKADKVSGATAGNFTALDASGNLVDSLKKPADFETLANKSTDIFADAASTTKYPSVKLIKDYADSLVVGLLDYRGGFNASVNAYPSSGGSGTGGAILKGDMWVVSVAGTIDGHAIHAGDSLIANEDTPGQTTAKWNTVQSNLSYVPEDVANKKTEISESDQHYPTNGAVYRHVAAEKVSIIESLTGQIDGGVPSSVYGGCGVVDGGSASTIF